MPTITIEGKDHAQDTFPFLMHVMAFVLGGGGGYHEASAEDAKGRIVAFFDTYLKN